MSNKDMEWRLENNWLQVVLKEARKQLNENDAYKKNFRKDALEVQKQLWEEVGSVSITNGLEQIVSFMEFMDTMKRQKRSHEVIRKLKEKYERVLLSPYFGRIDFLEKGEVNAEKYYIGTSNLINDNYDILVHDWRAPVSGMFYDYEIGDAGYKCPEGVIEGKLTLKRQYKIANGELQYMFDSNLKIDDDILQDILSKSADGSMKAIVTTIQREQNKIIRNEKFKNIIVQGPAGSGKTSVALHRIAYLLYKHRDKITAQNIVIFSPNEIFNDYIANVLPQLGEENMYQTTFKDYMHKALGSELTKEDYCEMMEYILASKKELFYKERINSIKYKSSLEFVEVLKNYAASLEKLGRDFKDIIFRDNMIISAKELQQLFFKDYSELPLKRKLQKLKERIQFLIKPYEEHRIGEISDELRTTGFYIDKAEIKERSIASAKAEMKEIFAEIDKMTEFKLLTIYKELFENLEFYAKNKSNGFSDHELYEIKRYTLENLRAGKLNYEDQSPLLYLKNLLGDIPKTSEIKYVIIDEAQDYTPLQYEILYQLFGNSNMTILGDLNQSINPYMNVGSYNNISHIFPTNSTSIINLTKSYRSTIEITKFSRKLLNMELTDECVERSGEEPLIVKLKDEKAINERIVEDIKLYKTKGYKSIGIITRTKKEAEELHSALIDRTSVNVILKDDDEYVSDSVVIPAYLAKGLEFDVVLIYNAGGENYCCEEERLLLYTACTRALHSLCVYYTEDLTPLL